MTEAGIVAVDYDQGFRRRARQCVGKPLLSHEVRLQQRDDGLFREVFLKGPALHSGRMEKGQWQPASLVDGEWFSTGDLGELDGKGRLYLRGRSKDTIVTGSGENLSPDEIEDRFQGVEGIEKLAVLGMRSPVSDQEEITLVLQLGDPNPSEASRAKVADQIYRLNQKVPISKRIRRVIVSGDPLPTTTVGKVRRPLLKKFIEEKRSSYLPLELKRTVPDQPTALPAGRLRELKEEVRELFAEVLGRPPRAIREEAHFIDELGGDSLQALALANLLEKKYRVVVPDAMLQECASVKEIAEALHKLLTEGGYSSASGASGAVQPDRTPIASFEETKEYRAFRLRLDQAGAFNPYFVSHDSVVRDTSLIEGKEVVNFASYNYLGLSGHPEVTKAAEEASRKYGTSTSGSRLVLEKSLYQELESEIARWKHVEDALVLVSGHATNVTFVGNFCNKNDLICYDFFSHDSILQGCRLSRSESKAFPHNDFRALEEILLRNRNHYEKILVVVEGVYSADGDVAPIPEFVKLKKKYGLFLMVDEAHSSCVLGKKGEGVDGHFGLSPDDIDIRMGTLSKGLGSCGGYLAGKRSLIEYLRYNLSGFVFSVGIPPASAAAALASLRLIQRDHSMVERLHANIRTFLEEAHRRNFHTCLAGESAVIPIMVGEDLAAFVLSKRLRERGIFAGPMVFPSVPAGRARIRFFVTSEHKPEQIVFALDALKESALQERISLPGYQEKVS
jgi:8-amino-7-oxononanoate synthase/acyl carrier protein